MLTRLTSHNWFVRIVLIVTILLSIFFAVYKNQVSPPAFNADEAAFGYNAYSILKTGADEYGTVLPLRLKSFGDYKMPLYSYLSIPFISVMGLNEISTRALNVLIAALFPLAMYFLTKELFQKKALGLISAVLIAFSLGKGIVAREAHEALLAAFLITLASYFFLKYLHSSKLRFGIYFVLSLFFSLFSYQSSRLFGIVFLIFCIYYFLIKKTAVSSKKLVVTFLVIALLLFGITDVIYKPARVQNLFLTSTAGFTMKITEFLNEGGKRIFYNKGTIGAQEVVTQYMQYFSPQFLAQNGDANPRFGFEGMAPITPFEYLFIFIGIYYLFKKKEKWRFYLLVLFFISPLTAALSWQQGSFTRSFFMLIPGLIISAYGIYSFLADFRKAKYFVFLIAVFLIAESLFLYYSWDFYLNHYPKRPIVSQSWEYGYRDLASFVKSNYHKYDTFYITKSNGQPYIFMLFYLQYPPALYQKQASLSSPDQYGFGQVEKFDKFVFNFDSKKITQKKIVFVGSADEFSSLHQINPTKIKKIGHNGLDIFWIYTND